MKTPAGCLGSGDMTRPRPSSRSQAILDPPRPFQDMGIGVRLKRDFGVVFASTPNAVPRLAARPEIPPRNREPIAVPSPMIRDGAPRLRWFLGNSNTDRAGRPLRRDVGPMPRAERS